MTQSILHTESQAKHAMLLTLSSGSQTFRYCRWDDNLTVESNTFTSMPSLSYDAEAQSGDVEDAKFSITMDAEADPVPALLTPYAHAPVAAVIQEVSPGDDTSLRNLFKGTFGNVKQNPGGNENIVSIDILGHKKRLGETVVGLPALTTCLNTLGDFRCQKDITADILTGTVQSVRTKSDNHIEISLTGSPNMQNARWRRGYVNVDGAKVIIRQVLSAGVNPNPVVELYLREFPPDSWVSQSVTLTPGCDGNISTCRTVWNNEEHFMGFGFAMPTRNPVFEQ